MAYELCNSTSKFKDSEESVDEKVLYLHFYNKNRENLHNESSLVGEFTFTAYIDDLLLNSDFFPKHDLERIYEQYCQFSLFLNKSLINTPVIDQHMGDISNNELEFFHMLQSMSELGVEKKEWEVCFSELGICKPERKISVDFQAILDILSGIFPHLRKESSEIKILFHDIEEVSTRFLLWLQVFDDVGLDIIFCLSENAPYSVSDFIQIFKPLNLKIHELEPYNHRKTSCFLKNDNDYFLKKDRWLVNFFHSLYKMWDVDKQTLKLTRTHLLNVFQGWWLPDESGRKLLNIYLKLEILMEEGMLIDGFIERIEFIHQQNTIIKEENSQIPFQMVSIFGEVTSSDYRFFIDSMKKINAISLLFWDNCNDLVFYTRILEQLHLFYQKKQQAFIEIEEGRLLRHFDTQLNKLMPENTPPSVLFTILREKIKFSLSYNEETLHSLSKENRDFYSVNLSNTLRIWWEFHNNTTKINKFAQVYVNNMLNSEIKRYTRDTPSIAIRNSIEKNKVMQITYERNSAICFFLCPYRYFSTYILKNRFICVEKMLYLKYYENLLLFIVWESISSSGQTEFNRVLAEVDENYHRFFPFITWKQRYDAINKVSNYLFHSITMAGTEVRTFTLSHMNMRLQFGEASFQGGGRPKPLPAFSDFVKKGYYSLHKIPKELDIEAIMPLRQEMTRYINGDTSNYREGEWCEYCVEKRNCKKFDKSQNHE